MAYKTNSTNSLYMMIATILGTGFVAGLVLMQSPTSTNLYPKAAPSAVATRSAQQRRTQAAETLTNTPAVTKTSDLLLLIQQVGRTDVSSLAKDLSLNEKDLAGQ